MEKLLTPLAIATILVALGGIIHNYWFYDGKRRRVPGQHRYNKNCVEMLWAKVTPLHSKPYEVQIWGYQELGAI